jgi:hypothetical protein
MSIVYIAFRRADPRHTNKVWYGRAINDVETQRPGCEQLLEGAHVDCWVHRVGSRCLLAIFGRYVDHYLAGIETFSTEELLRVFAAVSQGLCIAQFLTKSQRPRVDGVGFAAFGRWFATHKLARARREAEERNKPDVYNEEVGIVLELPGAGEHGARARARTHTPPHTRACKSAAVSISTAAALDTLSVTCLRDDFAQITQLQGWRGKGGRGVGAL